MFWLHLHSFVYQLRICLLVFLFILLLFYAFYTPFSHDIYHIVHTSMKLERGKYYSHNHVFIE